MGWLIETSSGGALAQIGETVTGIDFEEKYPLTGCYPLTGGGAIH